MGQRLPSLPLSYEELRSVVLEQLKTLSGGTQFASFYSDMVASLVRKGLAPTSIDRSLARQEEFVALARADQWRIQDILWDLLIEGIIRPGSAEGCNDDLPFFHVTQRGRQILKDGVESPYDPDGFIKRLETEVPNLDGVITTYLNESLHTFRIGCLLSSTVTLGCASERSLLILIEAYASSLQKQSQEKFRKNTEGRMIKRQFDEFSKMLESELKPRLPAELKDDLDVTLNAIFSMIREFRNDAGHPTGRVLPREQVYASLMVFVTYLKRVYRLIGWLQQQAASPD